MALDKYRLSLTEREIRRNLVKSVPNANGGQAIAFIRTLVGTCDDLREFDKVNELAALRQRIEQELLPDRIARGTAHCEPKGELDANYLKDFAAVVEAKLKSAIDEWIKLVSAETEKDNYALHAERDEHAAFRDEKLKVFVGRDSNLATIARYLTTSDATHPLVLHGPSGSGKTALMARAIEAAAAAKHPRIVFRFIGASAGSSDLRALLLSVIDDLAVQELVQKPAEFDQDANKFSAQINALLASISGPAVIFLDALDQLGKPYRLDWLPATLPTGVRLVLSVLDDPAYEADSDVYRQLKWRLWPQEAFLAIEPLSPTDGRNILLALEAQGKRRLRDSQRSFVLRHFEAAGASPLYLRAAFEIARGWRSWDADAGRLVLATDTSKLIAQFFAELTSKHHHKPELMSRTLDFIAAAKEGLSVKELTDVLARDSGVMTSISSRIHGHDDRKTLPPSVWVRLHRALKPFLTEKRVDDQPLLQFFHRQVADWAQQDHYKSVKAERHAALATYFENCWTPEGNRKIYDKRSLSELPYQLHHVGDAQHAGRLNDVLLSPEWMQQKLAAFSSPLPLIEDYRAYAPYEPGNKTAATLVGRTLELTTAILARNPSQLLLQLLGRLNESDDPKLAATLRMSRSLLASPALVPVRASFMRPGGPEIARLEGHAGGIIDLSYNAVNGLLTSRSTDKTMIEWDIRSKTVAKKTGLSELSYDVEQADRALEQEHALTKRSIRLSTFSVRTWRRRRGYDAIGPTYIRCTKHREDRPFIAFPAHETKAADVYSGALTALVAVGEDQFASGATDGIVRVWNPISASAEAVPSALPRIKCLIMIDEERFITVSDKLRVYRVLDGQVIAEYPVNSVGVHGAVKVRDRVVAFLMGDMSVRLYDHVANVELARIHMPFGFSESVIGSAGTDHVLVANLDHGKALALKLSDDLRPPDCAERGNDEERVRRFFGPRDIQRRDDTKPKFDVRAMTSTALGLCIVFRGLPWLHTSETGFLEVVDLHRQRTIGRWPASNYVRACCAIGDNYVVTACEDGAVRAYSLRDGSEIAQLIGDVGFCAIDKLPGRNCVVVGDVYGQLHWIEVRLEGDGSPLAGSGAASLNPISPPPAPFAPPPDIATVASEFRVELDALTTAHIVETYRGHNLFALADGRIYLDGLIAVGSLDHARATLDELARRAGEPDA